MRYGIFSDIHSNLEALEAVIAAYKHDSIDEYLCVGDVVGYAANPKECIQTTKSLCMITVAGNHDWASPGLISLEYFNPLAREAVLWTRHNLDDEERYFLETLKPVYQNPDLTLVHATLDNPQDFNYLTDAYLAGETFRLMQTHICFVGHTHVGGFFVQEKEDKVSYYEDNHLAIEKGKKYIVNVGSVGQPRDSNPLSAYCIYDTNEQKVSLKRVSYDMQTTRDKIIAAGLPRFLGDRLLVGR